MSAGQNGWANKAQEKVKDTEIQDWERDSGLATKQPARAASQERHSKVIERLLCIFSARLALDSELTIMMMIEISWNLQVATTYITPQTHTLDLDLFSYLSDSFFIFRFLVILICRPTPYLLSQGHDLVLCLSQLSFECGIWTMQLELTISGFACITYPII